MRHLPPRAMVLRSLGLGLIAAVALSFVPALRFEWVPTSVLDTLTPSFVPAGADELPAADDPGTQVTADRHEAADVVEPFAALAVRFEDQPGEPVFVRVHDTGADWTDWVELEVSADHAENGTPGSPSSEPVFVGDADAYELNVPSGVVAGAEVVLIRDELRRAIVDAEPLADASITPLPGGVHSRSEWGARASRSVSYGSTIKLAVVHHSVTTNDYSAADVPALLRSIQAYHMDSRGWSDIGYNFAVDRFGGVWEARGGGIDRPVVGAHAAGFNTNTVGIVVLGDYSATGISAAARESVARVAGWKMFLHGTNPAGSVAFTAGTGSTKYTPGTNLVLPGVVGHRDVGSTSCPGSVHGQLPWVRTRAQQWTDWLRATSVPFGNLELIASGPGVVTARGWAVDPDAGGPSPVRLTAGGLSTTVTADEPRPDVAAAHPEAGPDHGFTAGLSGVPPGYQQACVTVIDLNAGLGDVSLGCRWVYVGDPTGRSPTGSIDAITGGPGTISVGGTVTDPDAPATAVGVAVEVDGKVLHRTTTSAAGVFLARLLGVAGGRRRVCIQATNIGEGTDLRVACREVDVGSAPPVGRLEWVGTNPRREVGFFGWAYDVETTGPVRVRVTVGSRRYDLVADRPREGVAFPGGYGQGHGFAGVVVAPPGNIRVCASALDSPTGAERLLGCRQVIVK